jgi:4-diphosphocytidyl-2-C-methyl-D-erythritol kinase
MIREVAPAKVNLVLRVGPVTPDGLHEICSLLAPLELHDVVEVRRRDMDTFVCEGVDGPNLAEAAVTAFRRFRPVPPVEVRIEKRIPVAAGLGGGSADAAAVLRALDALISDPTSEWAVPLEWEGLVLLATPLGSDVPSQVAPGNWVISGTGAGLRPAQPLPQLPLVLVPSDQGLSTAEVYREADRLGIPRPIDPEEPAVLAARGWPDAQSVAAALHNDLEPAALSLRPELADTLERVRELGALGAMVSGSGPTVFGVFESAGAAAGAAGEIPGAITTAVRGR